MFMAAFRHSTIATILLCLAATTGAANTLKIATFNAEFLTRPKVERKFHVPANERERWKDPAFRDNKFAEATRLVARYIAEHARADILVLTEVGNRSDVEELRTELANNGVHFPHLEVCDCTSNGITRRKHPLALHVAVLSRYPLMDVQRRLSGSEGYFAEEDDPESEQHTVIGRGMEARFETAGRSFRLYAVHFTSEARGHREDMQRVAQASILRRLTLPALQAGEHVIVAGDLNDRRGDPALRRVRGLDDIWPDLIQTGHHRYFRDVSERWTYEFRGQRQQIDHILLSQSIVAAVKQRKGIRAQTGPFPGKEVSDHRPLFVTLTFP